MKSWNEIWYAPSSASPKRATTAPARTNEPRRASGPGEDELPHGDQPSREGDDRRHLGRADSAHDQPDEAGPHAGLRDRGSPRGPLDPPVEPVDEEHLEDDVERVPGHDQDERRGQVGDPAEETLASEREEERGDAERDDPKVGGGVVGGLSLDADKTHDRLSEHRDRCGEQDPDREREPKGLCAEPPGGRPLPRPRSPARPGPSCRTGGS